MKKTIVLAAILVTIGSAAVYASDPPKTAPLPATNAPIQASGAGNQYQTRAGLNNVPVGGGVTVGGNVTVTNGQTSGVEGGVHFPF